MINNYKLIVDFHNYTKTKKSIKLVKSTIKFVKNLKF